ncbi:CDP-alcohol phosphatidyltransferase family protein [Pseudovibrio sp. Tun.PSC04-5.I4]|uniref:CDP-alcohol phosphatidyltransferase family protein n=1 Tax=Pseudovibrio sp. Tun.PSC04-5.I4 TaxID=1798213 RepID=UPI000890542D|nr:CDP-alcohol phosphatidyltransferase family protein [Pseudovibrio sp. Tun.PSC04-5.I4]SDR03554.1 phosphatidylcholine synthase [Pseudovibrio sp. Tun.PSC04-5.I4]
MTGQTQTRLFLIHILTALGAPIALFALVAGANGNLPMMFFWLWVALVVDGLDGPLARKYDIQNRLPRWSGVILDLVIDYATYVFLPAFALYQSGLLSEFWGLLAGAVIVFTGAIYFADGNMKTDSGGFSGFPGVWNMVIVVLVTLQSPPWIIIGMVIVCSVLTFAPVEFVHPVRTVKWRPLTISILMVWSAALALALYQDFIIENWLFALITATSLYLFCVGAAHQVFRKI